MIAGHRRSEQWGPAPAVPDWLAAHLPFERRLFLGSTWPIHVMTAGEGPTVLLLHGNPVWGFLYRRIGAALARMGYRVVIPDLVGFGLSGKPRDPRVHTLEHHIRWVGDLVDEIAPDSFAIVGQDWGGPIAAGLAVTRGPRVTAAVFGNTALLEPRRPLRVTTFHRISHWPGLSDLLFRGLLFPLPQLRTVQGDPGSIGSLEQKAYQWPFRRLRDRRGPLALARMVPDREGHPSLARLVPIERWYRGFQGPVGLIWGRRDPILGRGLRRMREARPDAEVVETDAGHFLQEEVPDEFVGLIDRCMQRVGRR